MKKHIATALVALSALSAVSIAARADYFGASKQAQQGQNLPGIFGTIEKSGI